MKKYILYIWTLFVAMTMGACASEIDKSHASIDDLPDLSDTTAVAYVPTMEHPGILHNKSSIEIMRKVVQRADENNDAYRSFLALKQDVRADSNYKQRNTSPIISRDDKTYAWTKDNMEHDFNAMHLNALMWLATQKEGYAKKSVSLLRWYANNLTSICPDSNDAMLLAGFHGFNVAFATEVLRYTWYDESGTDTNKLTADDWEKINKMLRNLFLPVYEKFYTMTAEKPFSNGNWGLCVTKGYLAFAILWNDTQMYQKGINYFLNNYDNGTLKYYFDGETGQSQESARDQGHAQLGVGQAGAICEIAWKQGNDLYSLFYDTDKKKYVSDSGENSTILKGFEYSAKWNAGHDVPYKKITDLSGYYWGIGNAVSADGRGNIRSIYHLAYNHYVGRKGLQMPYTKELIGNSEGNKIGRYDGDGLDYDTFQFCDGLEK